MTSFDTHLLRLDCVRHTAAPRAALVRRHLPAA